MALESDAKPSIEPSPEFPLDRPRPGKRMFDLLCAGLGLSFLALPMLLIALLMLVVQGRPILFKQTRVGKRGKRFVLYKFRSMSNANPGSGPEVTSSADQRITPLGFWLRKLKLDELPQLWNVLIGDMSLVGPRPEVPTYVNMYSEDQRSVLDLTPGLTDPNVTRFLDESELLANADDPNRVYIDSIMPEKIRVNLDYGARATFLSDLKLVLFTVKRIFRMGAKP